MFQLIRNRYGGKKAFLKYWTHGLLNIFFRRYKKFGGLPAQVNRIVFVCKGNICRSALAEWVFRSICEIPCCSLGVDTTSGVDANERIAAISLRKGLDLSKHKTTSIDDFVPRDNDLYVCMEPAHIKNIQDQFGLVNIYLLGLLDNPAGAYIHDPYAACDEYAVFCVEKIIRLSGVMAKKPL